MKTLQEYMKRNTKKLEIAGASVNAFFEEMERAKDAEEYVKQFLPQVITESLAKPTFLPGWENPPGYADWMAMKEAGFIAQRLQGMELAHVSFLPDESENLRVKEYASFLPYKN